MRAVVVSDARGKILAIGKLQEVGGQLSGITEISAMPIEGQQVHQLELPPELMERSLREVIAEYRINREGERVQLIPQAETQERP
jgi:hypothetical protein